MPTILIFCDYFKPGFKAGGPIRTISNLIDWFSEEFNFYVMTSDRDFLDKEAYSGLLFDQWGEYEDSHRMYSTHKVFNVIGLIKRIKKVKYDAVYLNSFFSLKFSIVPILLFKFGLLKNCKIILCPRGELGEEALNIKPLKKKVFIKLARLINSHTSIKWQATNLQEKEQIERMFGPSLDITISSNLPLKSYSAQIVDQIHKEIGEVRLIYVGRVSPIKNIELALESLGRVVGSVFLDIYGPVESEKYSDGLKLAAEKLPSNIIITFKGAVANNQLQSLYENYHFFVSPTKGENFGHAIFEALNYSTPLIISNRTPWRDLSSRNAGWDIDLNADDFTDIFQQCVDMNDYDYRQLVSGASKVAREYVIESGVLNTSRELFLM